MATTKSPGRKRRSPVNVHDIGNVGRMTGITLNPRELNEDGLEIPDGLFSPTPGKPSTKKVTRRSNGTSTSSEDMSIAHSSAPEPSEVLTSRRRSQKDGKAVLPLPVMRSPIKTHLGATPRRGSSVGPLSPVKSYPNSQTRERPQQSVKRRLDFSTAQGRQSPYSGSKSPTREAPRANGGSAIRKSIYDLPESPEPYENMPDVAQEVYEDYIPPYEMEEDNAASYLEQPQTVTPGRYRHDPDQVETMEQLEEEAAAALLHSGGSGKRKREEQSDVSAPVIAPELLEEEAREVEEMPPPKKKGRQPKGKKGAVLASRSTNSKVQNNNDGRKRDANGEKTSYSQAQRQRQRHQTPMEEDGVFHTRSGRNVYKPLEYWKGEHAIFEENTRLPGLKEIIRVEDVTPVKRKRPRYGSKRPKRGYSVFEDDLDDDELEPWELDDGVVSAPVSVWDSERGVADPDEEVEQPLAFAAGRMQPQAAPDNPNFMFTKTLTMPFFGSGVIELPPKGMKGLKNSRKFQFVFFVYSGKVAVEICGTQFVISKGGMWQVPRGNFYSITNESDHTAKIFFAQGCEHPVETVAPSLEGLR